MIWRWAHVGQRPLDGDVESFFELHVGSIHGSRAPSSLVPFRARNHVANGAPVAALSSIWFIDSISESKASKHHSFRICSIRKSRWIDGSESKSTCGYRLGYRGSASVIKRADARRLLRVAAEGFSTALVLPFPKKSRPSRAAVALSAYAPVSIFVSFVR